MNTALLNHRRALTDQVADRIIHDPAFRQAMARDPEAAMQEAGFLADMMAPGAFGVEEMRAQPCPYSCWNTTCTSMFSTGKWS